MLISEVSLLTCPRHLWEASNESSSPNELSQVVFWRLQPKSRAFWFVMRMFREVSGCSHADRALFHEGLLEKGNTFPTLLWNRLGPAPLSGIRSFCIVAVWELLRSYTRLVPVCSPSKDCRSPRVAWWQPGAGACVPKSREWIEQL